MNFYKNISRDGYIADSQELYTRKQMARMLEDSGLSVDEIKTIYELNHEAAIEEACKIAESIAIGCSYDDYGFPDEEEIGKEMFDITWVMHLGLWLFITQSIACAVWLYFYFAKHTVSPLSFFLILFLTWIISFVCTATTKEASQDTTDKYHDKIAKYSQLQFKGVYASNSEDAISALNTVQMYDCMLEYLYAHGIYNKEDYEKNISNTEEP